MTLGEGVLFAKRKFPEKDQHYQRHASDWGAAEDTWSSPKGCVPCECISFSALEQCLSCFHQNLQFYQGVVEYSSNPSPGEAD